MDIRILIIDDDELVAMSLEMILNAEDGMTAVGKGYSGTDAIRLYDELLPDVLLMDIRMKDMTGLDAAEQSSERKASASVKEAAESQFPIHLFSPPLSRHLRT